MATRRCTACGTTWTSGGMRCPFCGGDGAEVAAKAPAPILPAAQPAPADEIDSQLDRALGEDEPPAPAAPVLDLDAAEPPPPEPEPADSVDSALDRALGDDAPPVSEPAPAPVEARAESVDAALDQALAERPVEPQPEPEPVPEPAPPEPAPEPEPAPVTTEPWSPPGSVKPSSYEPEPEPEPVAAPKAPGEADLDNLFADRPIQEDAPAPAPEPEPEPEPEPAPPPPRPVPVRPKTSITTKPPSGVVKPATSQTSRNPTMNKPTPAKSDRSQRRVARSLAGLLAIALAFVACNLLASFVPQVATSFDTGTEKLRSGLLAAGSPAMVGGIAAGAFVLLILTMVFLAGLEGKAGFMVPAVILALVAGILGIQPMGHRLTLERTNTAFEGQVKSLKDEAAQWKSKTGAAEDLVKARDASIAELTKKIEDQEKAAGAAAETASKEISTRDERIKSLVNAREQLAVTVLDQKTAIADKDKRIATLEQDAAARTKEIDALKKANDALKKEVEELKKRLPK